MDPVMQALLLTLAVLAGSGPTEPESAGLVSLPDAAMAVAPSLETGSLIFSSGDCLAVRMFTASPYTHVAAVVVDGAGECMVYDSTNGVGVRKLSLDDYLATQAPVVIHVHQPRRPLSAAECAAFQAHLESQLGRPYAIAHHLTGERCEGLHCAEYVTDALMTIKLVRAERPPRVSPASLREGIVTRAIYTPGESIQLAHSEPPAETGTSACEQLWIDTRTCCRDCCRKLSGWFLCR
jgi:hypothetical protein